MSQSIVTIHSVRRAVFTTPRPWDDVVQALRSEAGQPDDPLSSWRPEGTDAASIAQSIESRAGSSGLCLFIERPLSKLFQLFAPEGTFHPRMTQFVVGDPLTAAKLYQAMPSVGLLVPPRIAVIELPDETGTEIVYDILTSSIGGENEDARAIAESVDVKFEKFVRSAL